MDDEWHPQSQLYRSNNLAAAGCLPRAVMVARARHTRSEGGSRNARGHPEHQAGTGGGVR